jgi:hypothetical protein
MMRRTEQDFRSAVVERAYDRIEYAKRLRGFPRHAGAEAQVADLDDTGGRQEYVRRLDITMNNILSMQVCQSV